MNSNNFLFSLDIGTRNVVGTLAVQEGKTYKIFDHEIIEHPERAMYDGQIHDIDKVVDVVEEVKSKLEERNGVTLTQVAIAAAGRALKTKKVAIERELDVNDVITKEMMDSVEMEAIQNAQAEIEKTMQKGEQKYYCVGYTVINYYLDGSMILNPKDHRGSLIKIELIATFLPHIVVDSLYTVVDRVGLEVVNLTLEPIAAINVAIPQNLRLLNLALVDVGAGTSDIAITKDGTIVSYAMVSAAGDRVTETLAKEFLLDFDSAEKLKVQLNKQEEHTFFDVIGIPHTLKTEEIMQKIEPTIKEITQLIGEKIVEYNEKAPSAIFCIGGGCQIPGFTEQLGSHIDLQKERIVIKSTDMLDNIEFTADPLVGPEYITPIGIGVTAVKEKENDFLQVSVDNKPIRLFNSKKLSVSDALILIGYNARKLLAERGESLKLIINGVEKEIKGGYGEPARIFINGAPSSLDSKLKNKDSIHVEPAVPGSKAEIYLRELVGKHRKITFNHDEIEIVYDILVNDNRVEENYKLDSGDIITYSEFKDLNQLLDGHQMEKNSYEILVNGKYKELDYSICSGDIIRAREKVNHLVDFPEDHYDVEEMPEINKEPEQKKSVERIYNYSFTVNEKPVSISTVREMVFVDIFDHIDFDISKAKGILALQLNGSRARFTDHLKTGDVIKISWK